jgi:hypothetical protein
MIYKRWRSIFLGGIFLLSLLAASVGQSTVSVMASVDAQSSTPHKVYLPAVHHVPSSPPGPNQPPLASTSLYFQMSDILTYPQKAYNRGCELGKRDLDLPGKQDSLVILAFGLPKYKDYKYGASGMLLGGFFNVDQIAKVVKDFGTGYWFCAGKDFDSHLRIAVGTNNYSKESAPNYTHLSVTFNHGKAWAQMVNNINEYFVKTCPNSCNGQVDVVGASDIELGWSSPQKAQDWVNGYDSVNLYPLYNFGAAEGCATFSNPTWSCGAGGFYWSKDLVYRTANAGPVYPIPEIYLKSGVHAQQWYLLSVYAAQTHGHPYDFVGALTNWGACQQNPGSYECQFIDNKPEQGWTQLYNLVNSYNSLLTWDDIPYSTDIMWSGVNK